MKISNLQSVGFSIKSKTSFCTKYTDKNDKYFSLHDKSVKKKNINRRLYIVIQYFEIPDVNNKMQIVLRFSTRSTSEIPVRTMQLERDSYTLF